MTRPVPDEVWQRLDPRAGVLSRRTRIRMWVALAAAVVLLVAGTLVRRSGVVVPRLVWPGGLHAWSLNQNGLARVEFVVSNAGWSGVTVLNVGRSAPGFELVRVDGGDAEHSAANPFPVTLRPGEQISAVLVYRLSDCESPPPDEWPVTARVQRPWGTMSVDVPVSGPGSPGSTPWQREVLGLWCDRPELVP